MKERSWEKEVTKKVWLIPICTFELCMRIKHDLDIGYHLFLSLHIISSLFLSLSLPFLQFLKSYVIQIAPLTNNRSIQFQSILDPDYIEDSQYGNTIQTYTILISLTFGVKSGCSFLTSLYSIHMNNYFMLRMFYWHNLLK